MQRRYARHLTRIKKANAFDIHQMHFFQIQNYLWSTAFDLGLDLINVLRSKLLLSRIRVLPLPEIRPILSVIDF